jgi:hypothetical protein
LINDGSLENLTVRENYRLHNATVSVVEWPHHEAFRQPDETADEMQAGAFE